MKHLKINSILLIFIATMFCASKISAQATARHRVAVFAPLYLDSAYIGDSSYRYATYTFPKFINPGLEFYEGVQRALDSLSIAKISLDVFVYDNRSSTETVAAQLNRPEMDSTELILVHCTAAEIRQYADYGLRKNIPVINVNMPNDGGVSGNPFYVMLNSTLRTQCEGIYQFMQKYYSQNKIIVFRKKGQLEDRIKGYFEDYGKGAASTALKLKYVELSDSFSVAQLAAHLDTAVNTLCVSGSLDENFGKRLVKQLASLKKKFPVSVMGMPTWDNITDFSKSDYKGIEIMYGTPFYNPKTDATSQSIINYFNDQMYARPTDMVFRGYDAGWKFVQLLNEFGKDISSHLADKKYQLFIDYDIRPIYNSRSAMPDYLENKKLYFIKKQDGVIKEVK
ncbi:MAG: amino acid ABC transporter substrate-binding protein [Bacteroidetes bacterium]|nr:amino acid ABC transporter substrate-binding protein [Bacteroidota bacterium]